MNRPVLLALGLASLALAPCVRERRQPRPTSSLDARSGTPRDASVSDASPADSDAPSIAPSLEAVIDAVRRRDLRAARALGDRLAPEVQRTREARYLRARIATSLGDHAAALPMLRGLGEELPVFSIDLARMEANAMARTDRHAEARAAYDALADRGGGEGDRARAALEAQAMGDQAAAAVMMRAWPERPPPGIDHARAWRVSARVFEATGDHDRAARAWQRLVIEEPDSGSVTEALTALTRLSAPLTTEQQLSRAAELVERARYREALAVLEPLPPGEGRSASRRLHLLGRAYYGARDRYLDAHATLRAASEREDNPDREEDAFLAARSLARADRDDDAVRAFDAVARTQRGRWSHEAAYRAAWLEAHHHPGERSAERLSAYLRDRAEAPARLRIEAGWELGWMLYTQRRYAEAVAPLERTGAEATHHLERGRGRYWGAMARLRSGDAEGALRGFQGAREDRPLTYYALLSEARLREQGVALEPLPAPPERAPAPSVPLPPKARWLRALGFDDEAADALSAHAERVRASLPRGREDEALALTYLSLGEARRAFLLASRHAELLDPLPTAGTRWVWDAGFPRPHAPLVEAAEDEHGLPRHYLFSIMRQESGFNARDVSSARAIGLLQMIPPTTRRVARTLGLEFREELLYDPAYNIRVGGWYIGRLYRQYEGVLPRTIGSYNAGPGAMGRWVQQFGDEDLDVFVERIPFDETRTYVRRVIQNLARYRYLYDRGGGAPLPLDLPLSLGDAGVEVLVDY